MIGLVYADYRDPAIKDTFHCAACDSFQDLSCQYPGEIIALTDPDVTDFRLWRIFQGCEFVFYWGHGQRNISDGTIVLGSSQNDYIPIRRIGQELKDKLFFLDACSIARDLTDEDFRYLRLVCPIDSSEYNTSVQMGCSLVANFFGLQMPFNTAFHHSVKQVERKGLYRLVGTGENLQIVVSENARISIVQVFQRLLDIWNIRCGV